MKKDPALWIAIILPLLLMAGVALSIYIPRLGADPQYSFLYSLDGSAAVRVEGEKLVWLGDQPGFEFYRRPRLYVHDTLKNESRAISFEEAQKLTLDENRVSPDGYTLGHGSNRGFFPFFFYEGDSGSFLTKGNASVKVNTASRYIQFIGWLK